MGEENKDIPLASNPSTASPVTPVPAATPAPAVAQAAPKPVVTAAPVKPLASPARRQFMISWLSLAWVVFAAATVSALSTVLRFLFPNVLFEPKTSFKVGKPDQYEVGKVDTRWEDKFGVWVIRSPEGIYALSTVCTHLGCKPSWLDGEQKFKCPCHGSGFYKTGINFEGPAPRPLERFSISLADDGQILIDKSKKFQFEKGEWMNPLSLLAV